jgi:hypothetical protein
LRLQDSDGAEAGNFKITNNIVIDEMPEGEFGNTKEEWNSLLGKSITNEVFLLWKWIDSWWDVFKKGGSGFCLFGCESYYLSLPKCQTPFPCTSD